MQQMEKPTQKASSGARAAVVRAFYDAVDKALGEQSVAQVPTRELLDASVEFEKVLAMARQVGDNAFVQTVETALNTFTNRIRVLARFHDQFEQVQETKSEQQCARSMRGCDVP